MNRPDETSTGCERSTDTGSVSNRGQVSYAIFRVARLHKLFAKQLLRPTGLFPGQELLMMRLWDEGPQRQSELVRTLESDAPSIARSVQRLERAGYVRRNPDPSDARANLIEATPASMHLRETIQQIWDKLEALTTRGMSDEESGKVLAALESLERTLMNDESSLAVNDAPEQ